VGAVVARHAGDLEGLADFGGGVHRVTP
jgi:hypothetical protein